MRRLFWCIFTIWIVAAAAICFVGSLVLGHPCFAPIVMEWGGDVDAYSQRISDYRTGITFDRIITPSMNLSPDGRYQIISNFDSDTVGLQIVSTLTGRSETLYSSIYRLAPSWSADSQSLFVWEYEYDGEILRSHRIFRLNLHSGEIMRDYGSSMAINDRMPNGQFFYVQYTDPETGQNVMASINTVTGELIEFGRNYPANFSSWSPDYQWWLRAGNGFFYIINAVTGQLHPEIDEPIEGKYPLFTDQSVWFTREDGETDEVWRVSLIDGSLHLEHENARLSFISRDDRWQALYRYADNTVTKPLYDRLTDSVYDDLNIYRVDFSADVQCMILMTDPHPAGGVVNIYVLETMQKIYSFPTSTFAPSFYWYNGE